MLESNHLFDLIVRDDDNNDENDQNNPSTTIDTSVIGFNSLSNDKSYNNNTKSSAKLDKLGDGDLTATKKNIYDKLDSLSNVKTRKSKTKLKSNKNLNEMVKDMASFEWNTNQITNSSSVNMLAKQLSEIVTTKEEAPNVKKQIKFENDDHNDQENLPTSTQHNHMNKSRSLNSTRSYMEYVSDLKENADKNSNKYKISSSKSRPAIFSSTLVSRSSSRSSSARIINILGKEIVKLPVELECEIKIKKKFDPLGIQSVDCLYDEGVNGCLVLRIEPNTACARDNRLKVGDYLLSVNNEQMRNLTNSTAKGILNRASLTSNDVV